MTETPTAEWPATDQDILSALAAAAINELPSDLGREDFLPCCPHECAPCAALLALHERGNLDDAVRPYVEHTGHGCDWWNEASQTVNWPWLLRRWCDPDTCEAAHPDQIDREEC